MTDPSPHATLVAAPPHTTLVGSRILAYATVESTNDRALQTGGDGTVVVADCQIAGRGRQGRRWHSAPGLGLYLSVALDGPGEGLMFAAALAVRDALRPYCRTDVKWPNDVLAAGRKVCGILIEHKENLAAVGIGINVHHRHEDFPEEIRDTATSLAMAAKRPLDRAEILRAVLTELDKRVILLRAGGLEAIWREWADACALKGRKIRCGDAEGVVTDIEPSGALCLDTANGPTRLVSGEITVLNGA
ncbi:MAG TPA: biotin--[acetyl-CoA-carboxylase] ligase [Candidatus Hydrogenedentes bacterium]|nr:biotin--[acetyl-CoA-carboxylase] ligase [Candidatus Hydrogenedentota bacterium]